MRPVNLVEVYTTTFSHSLFYWKFSTWCLLKKRIPLNPENYWVNNFCLKFLYLGLLLFLNFCILTVIIINIHWNKQPSYTWNYLWNLRFVSVFFLNFLKDKSLLVSRRQSEEGSLNKTPDWKLLFLLKIKIR